MIMPIGRPPEPSQGFDQHPLGGLDGGVDETIVDLPDRELMSVLPTMGWLGGGPLSSAAAQVLMSDPAKSAPVEEAP
jgi:hypothetical protein